MDALTLVITILQLLCGLAVIVIVLFQSGKSAGLSGAIGGVADSFLSQMGWGHLPDPDAGPADPAGLISR